MAIDRVTIQAGRLLILIDVGFQQAVLYRPPSRPMVCSLDELSAACRRVIEVRKHGGEA